MARTARTRRVIVITSIGSISRARCESDRPRSGMWMWRMQLACPNGEGSAHRPRGEPGAGAHSPLRSVRPLVQQGPGVHLGVLAGVHRDGELLGLLLPVLR